METNMLPIGVVLHGAYRIDKHLASGGFGNTYAVTHLGFNEKMAVKEFYMNGVNEREADHVSVSVSNAQQQAQYDEQLEKFKKEARRLRSLNSDNIVHVYDLFDENGTSYYVMDYIDGESLSARLNRTGKPIEESEVEKILTQLLNALQEVHNNHLWHLDLKPANIMQDRKGVVHLIDFGASKQLSAEGGATASSALCFTPGYAPPEQVEQNMDKFGPWTDFYALGATLFNLLTAQKPPQSSDINEQPEQAFAPLNAVGSGMRNLVVWLMQTNRTRRPQNVEEISSYLDKENKSGEATRISQPTETVTKPVPPTTPDVPVITQRRRWIVYAAVAAAVAVVGVALWLLLGSKDSSKEIAQKEATLEEMVEYYQDYDDLDTDLDTLAYAIGMCQSEGLTQYLDGTLNMDTTKLLEFSAGVLLGVGLTDKRLGDEEDAAALAVEEDKAVESGIDIGRQIKNQMMPQMNEQVFGNESSENLPMDIFVAGFIQGYCHLDNVMNLPEAKEAANRLMNKYQEEKAANEYRDNKEAGERFLFENASNYGVTTCASGLQYKVLHEGNGRKPKEDDVVRVHYEGRLIDGTVFDSSYERGEPVEFGLQQVIKGWTEALTKMPVGSEWEIYIPQELAYGSREMDRIKPFSTLIFKVKLLDIVE